MKHVMPARREMGIRTVFNMLGPLTNPAGANAQVIGVYAAALTELLAHVLAELGTIRAFVVHGADGLDEISNTGESHIAEVHEGVVRTTTRAPGGLRPAAGRDRRPAGRRPRRRTPRSSGACSAGERGPAARHRADERGGGAGGGRQGSRLQGGRSAGRAVHRLGRRRREARRARGVLSAHERRGPRLACPQGRPGPIDPMGPARLQWAPVAVTACRA